MMDYGKMSELIAQWGDSVHQYCDAHNIPDMELKNLRVGDLYDYELYTAYLNVIKAVRAYKNTPESPVYAGDLLACLKKWYVLTSDGKAKQLSLRIAPKFALEHVIRRIR